MPVFAYISFTFHFQFIILKNLGLPYLGKTTAVTRAALPSHTSACWVFSCFRNPPNSDMDYRIFNVCMRSFLCVHIHTGVGDTDESAQHFWLGKTLTNFSCAHDTDRVRTSGLWISSPMLSLLSHPVTPLLYWYRYVQVTGPMLTQVVGSTGWLCPGQQEPVCSNCTASCALLPLVCAGHTPPLFHLLL